MDAIAWVPASQQLGCWRGAAEPGNLKGEIVIPASVIASLPHKNGVEFGIASGRRQQHPVLVRSLEHPK